MAPFDAAAAAAATCRCKRCGAAVEPTVDALEVHAHGCDAALDSSDDDETEDADDDDDDDDDGLILLLRGGSLQPVWSNLKRAGGCLAGALPLMRAAQAGVFS